MNNLQSGLLATLVIAVLHTSACAESLTLRYGQTASTLRSVFSLPIYVAEREGFFAREGLVVKVVPIPGGTDKMIAALQDATVDVSHVSVPFLIQSALEGSDAVAIVGEFANPIYSLVARPEITSFADLKGKTVGLAVAADMVAISSRKLLAENGLRASDYTVKEMVGTPARAECLTRGACVAVPLGQPDDFLLRDKGYHILGLSSDAVPHFQYTVTAVRRSYAAAHREAISRYVRALAATFKFIHDPAKREKVAQTIVETTDSTFAIARQVLSLYLDPDRGVLPQEGELDREGLKEVISFMGETGAIKGPLPPPDQFIDLSYLRATGVNPQPK